MAPARETYTGLSSVMAGCFDCNGYDAIWQSRNALAVAARHHDSTGHVTWCDQVISVTYGGQSPRRGSEDSDGG